VSKQKIQQDDDAKQNENASHDSFFIARVFFGGKLSIVYVLPRASSTARMRSFDLVNASSHADTSVRARFERTITRPIAGSEKDTVTSYHRFPLSIHVLFFGG